METKQRNNIIDAFRGLAILAVMAYHYTIRWPDLYGFEHTYSPIFGLGKYGVHLFFVVSGLVITMTVLRSADAIEFAVRRFARLYPAFVAAACVTFVCMQWGPPQFRRGFIDLFASLSMDAKVLGHSSRSWDVRSCSGASGSGCGLEGRRTVSVYRCDLRPRATGTHAAV